MQTRLLHWSDPAFDDAAPAGLRAWVEERNAFVAPERLRRYQSDLLRTGLLEFPDPATGASIGCSGTVYFGAKGFAWRFASAAGTLWLASGQPAHGFELSGLLLPGGQTFLRFDRFEDRDFAAAQVQAIEAVAAAGIDRSAPASALPAYLVAGHENFAHFMWNELPALIEAEGAGPPRVHVVSTWETIAPLEQLVRWGAPVPVNHISARLLVAAKGGFHPAILFAAGSSRMPEATKARLVEVCGPPPPGPPGRFAVWLSLRLTHRHPKNQVAVFALLLDALAALPFPVEVILDGHSLAADLDLFERHFPQHQRDLAEGPAELAAALQAAITPAAAARLTITDATRSSLPRSIALAARADFYVCHHGTQQHKIGWIYPTPGVIHAPPDVLRSFPAGWTQHQSEGAALPDYVPAHLVEDVEPSCDLHPNSVNYRFTDPARVVAFVLDRLGPVAAAKGFAAG